MKNKISSSAEWILRISVLASSLLPAVSLAQFGNTQQFGAPAPQQPPVTNVSFTTISGALCTLIAWIFTLLIVLAVIYVLWAAYNYLTSNGEEEKIKKANHQLLYAAIALVVAILSRGIPLFVGSILGATFQGC